MPPGRKPSTEPALAYDYRRAILLVQILASDMGYFERKAALVHLAREWNVPLPLVETGDMAIVRRLAQHAIEHYRRENT